MQIQNKLEKFFMTLSGILLTVLIVLGIKVQKDGSKVTVISNDESGNDVLASEQNTTAVSNQSTQDNKINQFPTSDTVPNAAPPVAIPADKSTATPIATNPAPMPVPVPKKHKTRSS